MRILAAAVLLAPAVLSAQLTSATSFGARLAGEARSPVTGDIEFFRGTDPRPEYHEQLGPGIGLGVEAGSQVHRRVHLSVAFDASRHAAERESADLSRTLYQISAFARLPVAEPNAIVQPYLSAGLALRRLHDADASTAPWPKSGEIWGSALMVGGGVQRRLSPALRLDAGVQVAWTTYESLTAGHVEKEIGTETKALPQARIGVLYRPLPMAVSADLVETRLPRVGERVRLTVAGRRATGEVVAASADSIVLQTRRGNGFEQVTVPVACVQALDAFVGSRSSGAAAISGAVRAVAIGTSVYLLAQQVGTNRLPDEHSRVALMAVAPSAVIGAILGSRRLRDEWTSRPLSSGSVLPAAACPKFR